MAIEMERCWSWLGSVMPRGSSSIPRSLLAVLLVYSLSSQFLPIEPYLVPYLINAKHFTNYQVTVDIFPISVYAQLVFTLLLAPACYYLSHKVVLTLGAFGVFLTYCIVWGRQSLLAMQIMQTSLTTTVSLLSFMVASELSQLLALQGAPYEIFFVISLSALGLCCIMTFLFPKEYSSSSLSSLTTFWVQNEGWQCMLRETWSTRTLQILSLWKRWDFQFSHSLCSLLDSSFCQQSSLLVSASSTMAMDQPYIRFWRVNPAALQITYKRTLSNSFK